MKSLKSKLTGKLNEDLAETEKETEEESDNFWEGRRQYILELLKWMVDK